MSTKKNLCNSNSVVSTVSGGATAMEIEMEPMRGHGSRMSFQNVSYSISVRQRCCGSCRKASVKEILNDVSGTIRPGLNAIMGPTGSGKTSLLDVLANRKDPANVTGKVLLNGGKVPKNFQYLSGYVVQNDLFIGTITVRESLWFCANMRLPASISRTEKRRRIASILTELGLDSCADTKIGTNIIRGISGGEKKRTSIAIEMLLEPKILFLDEPTTGLDAATASSVMRLLKRLGDEGNTIVCSIHQPRYSIFRLFDSLTLLSMGHLVYHGPGTDALAHFEGLGYECQAHDNPADFLLDVLIGEYESNMIGRELDSTKEPFVEVKQDLVGLTEKFRLAVKNKANLELNGKESTDIPSGFSTNKAMYANGFLHQLWVLLGRTFKNILRNPAALMGNIFLNIIIGIVFGLLYYKIYDNPGSEVQNVLGILFFICTSLLFGSISVINAFTLEKDIFIHEHISGYYRVVSYFIAKVLADLIPLRTIAPIIFCSITYWMVGLKAEVGAFFIFLVTSLLMGYASVGIGLFYSSSFSQPIAQLCLVLTFVFTIIFSGLLVNVDQMLPWLSWLKYMSVARYGLVGLSVNELKGREFTLCGNDTNKEPSIFTPNITPVLTGNQSCTVTTGEAILFRSLSVGESAESIGDWDLWKNNVALSCICLLLYTFTYIQLMRTKKYS
uniref:broad substrate specificity ATP-binding cassette transporter ABCG2-like n=1 Tax=Styela clava TaxID=7725 RepID=UPI001939472F|nr:broad substrate specificity ATP-binding cassette transporter ABCG2-like [Styela clava]